MAKQSGAPVTIEGWLCRAMDDEGQPTVLAEATLFEKGVAQRRAVMTKDGLGVWALPDLGTTVVPSEVLKALLKISGWKIGPHVFQV